jgi:subtilisin family serine protease
MHSGKMRRMKIKIYLLTLLMIPGLATIAQKESSVTRGQLLVKFKPQVVPENFMVGFQTFARDGGGIWLEKKLSKAANIHLVGYDTLTVNALHLLEQIKKDPQVEYACFDLSVEPRGEMPDDPNLESQWGLFTIGANKVWELTKGGVSALGDTIVVAILDTGFDIYHEDLINNIWTNKGEKPGDKIDNDQNGYVDDVNGWNFIQQQPNHMADHHGSSVAGIIGAQGNNGKGITGLNWHVKLMVFETRLVSDIIAAYDYIIDQRERFNRTKGKQGAFVVVTNASFGVNKIKCVDQPLWGEMYDRLGTAGILSVAGAANNPWNVDEVGDMPTTCQSNYLLTVLNTNTKDERYAGSAFGPVSIDMGAPGQQSFSTRSNNEYGVFHGNSAAAPHLAGAVALLYSIPRQGLAEEAMASPAQMAMKIRNNLLSSVDKVSSLVSITATGGRLNVFNAMVKLLDQYPEKKAALSNSQLLVYPNPVVDEIYVEMAKSETETAILSIYNVMGQQIKQIFLPQGVNRARVLTNGWKPGNYWVFSPGDFHIRQASFVVQGQ